MGEDRPGPAPSARGVSVQAKRLLAEAQRRNKFAVAAEASSRTLFAQQRAVYDSRAKRVVLKPGRRAGKTRTILPIALRAAARFPGSIIPVLERTLACNAAKAFWKNLQAFNDAHDLGIEFRHTIKDATLPNGSHIQIYGVDTLELADKLRGEAFPIWVVDEAGTFRPHVLEYLVDECLSPGTMDYDGQGYLVGTPSQRKEGYWYERCHDPEWEQHHWTLLDNIEYGQMPYQKSRAWREEALKEEILAKGFLPREPWAAADAMAVIEACDHPKFRREFMGEWIDHIEDLMYEYHPDRNLTDRLPITDHRHPWRYGLSIDLGFNDPTAFVITGTREGDPYIYVIESMEHEHMIPSQIAAQIERYRMSYGYFQFIVADTGGGGKMAVEEMNRKYGCGIIPAQKTAKMVFVEHLNGDFRTGRLQLVKSTNQELAACLYMLPLNEAGDDAHPDYSDHLPDALLYGHRQWNVARVGWESGYEPPTPGSPRWVEAQIEAEEAHGDRLAAATDPAEEDFPAWLLDELE